MPTPTIRARSWLEFLAGFSQALDIARRTVLREQRVDLADDLGRVNATASSRGSGKVAAFISRRSGFRTCSRGFLVSLCSVEC